MQSHILTTQSSDNSDNQSPPPQRAAQKQCQQKKFQAEKHRYNTQYHDLTTPKKLALIILFLTGLFFITPYALVFGIPYVVYTTFNDYNTSTEPKNNRRNNSWQQNQENNYRDNKQPSWWRNLQWNFSTVFEPVNILLPIAFLITYFAIVQSIHLIPTIISMLSTAGAAAPIPNMTLDAGLMALCGGVMIFFWVIPETMTGNITSIAYKQMYTPIGSLALLLILAVSSSATTVCLLSTLSLAFLLAPSILRFNELMSKSNNIDILTFWRNLWPMIISIAFFICLIVQLARVLFYNYSINTMGLNLFHTTPVFLPILLFSMILETLLLLYFYCFKRVQYTGYAHWKNTVIIPFLSNVDNIRQSFLIAPFLALPLLLLQFLNVCLKGLRQGKIDLMQQYREIRNNSTAFKLFELALSIVFWSLNASIISMTIAIAAPLGFKAFISTVLVGSLTSLFFFTMIFLFLAPWCYCLLMIHPTAAKFHLHGQEPVTEEGADTDKPATLPTNGNPTTKSEKIMMGIINSAPIILFVGFILIYYQIPLPPISPQGINYFLIATNISFASVLALYYGEHYQKIIDTAADSELLATHSDNDPVNATSSSTLSKKRLYNFEQVASSTTHKGTPSPSDFGGEQSQHAL
jgi:hypothetical protein